MFFLGELLASGSPLLPHQQADSNLIDLYELFIYHEKQATVCVTNVSSILPSVFYSLFQKTFVFIGMSIMKIIFACSEASTYHRDRADHKSLSSFLHALSSERPLQVREDGPHLESEAEAGGWKLGTSPGHLLPLVSTLEITREGCCVKQS